jgi:hypothetical protein
LRPLGTVAVTILILILLALAGLEVAASRLTPMTAPHGGGIEAPLNDRPRA